MLPIRHTNIHADALRPGLVWLYKSKYFTASLFWSANGTRWCVLDCSADSWRYMSSIRCRQSTLMPIVIQESSSQLPTGTRLEHEEKMSRPVPSREKDMHTRGRSGPLSLPMPCAKAKTAPARCGHEALALQRYTTRDGRQAQGKLKTKPLGP